MGKHFIGDRSEEVLAAGQMGGHRRSLLFAVCGTLADAVGDEQDVIGLQRHVLSFRLQDLLNVYRNLSAAIFAFPDDLGIVQARGRVRPFRGRQCLQHRNGTGIP